MELLWELIELVYANNLEESRDSGNIMLKSSVAVRWWCILYLIKSEFCLHKELDGMEWLIKFYEQFDGTFFFFYHFCWKYWIGAFKLFL